MPEVTDQSAKPPRTWRPMVFWTASILLAPGLAWFVGAVVVPVWQVHRFLTEYDKRAASSILPFFPPSVEILGKRDSAARKLSTYLRLPDCIAKHRRSAIICLGDCGPAATPALRRMTGSPDIELRAAALMVLSLHILEYDRDGSLLPLVVDGSYDHAPRVRKSVILGLRLLDEERTRGNLPPWPEVSSALASLLEDPEEDVRYAAAEARVGRDWPLFTNDPAIIAALGRALTDPSSRVRRAAAEALGNSAAWAEKSIPALERLRADTAGDVRSAAAEALKKIRREEDGK